MVTTFAVLIGTSLSTRAQRITSSPQSLCSMNISAYVREINEEGNEVPLDFNQHPELHQSLWGIFDSRRSSSAPIPFNQNSLAQYQVFTTDRSFVPFPDDNEIYDKGEFASATLAFERNKYNLIRKEIKTCSMNKSQEWLCTEANDKKDTLLTETVSNLRMDCGVKLEFGWVVKPINPSSNSSSTQNFATNNNNSDTAVAINKAADINGDEAFNTLDLLAIIANYAKRGDDIEADVNHDSVVNALDYTIVVHAIEAQ